MRCVARRRETQNFGNKGQARPHFLVLGDQSQENAVFKCTAEIEIAHDRVELLAVAVDTAVTLLEAIGVEGQFQVDQVVASLMKVQTFRGRVCTDEDQIVSLPKLLGDRPPFCFVVVAVHREDRADSGRILQGLRQGKLTIDILGIDKDVRSWFFLANLRNDRVQALDFGVLFERGIRQVDQFVELLDDVRNPTDLTRAASRLAVERGELLGHVFGFQEAPLLFLVQAQNTESIELALVVAQRFDSLSPAFLILDRFIENALETLGDNFEC